MTDYREEQEGELETLRSIYPEDELKGDHSCLKLYVSGSWRMYRPIESNVSPRHVPHVRSLQLSLKIRIVSK